MYCVCNKTFIIIIIIISDSRYTEAHYNEAQLYSFGMHNKHDGMQILPTCLPARPPARLPVMQHPQMRTLHRKESSKSI